MNEDYLDLGYNPNALIITCINYQDPTRLSAQGRGQVNPYLEKLCRGLENLGNFIGLKDAALALVKGQVLAPPVNPATGAAQQAPAKQPVPPKQTAKADLAPPSGLTTEEIKTVQMKLKSAVCSSLEVDGKLGAATKACVQKYQDQPSNKLTPSGDLDPQTLELLGVHRISTQKP